MMEMFKTVRVPGFAPHGDIILRDEPGQRTPIHTVFANTPFPIRLKFCHTSKYVHCTLTQRVIGPDLRAQGMPIAS